MYSEVLLNYEKNLNSNSERSKFVTHVPWHLDCILQDSQCLLKTLILESKLNSEYLSGFFFSLIVPVYNISPDILKETILSVLCQSWQNWELILVDDCSPSKEHYAVVEHYAELDSRIKFVKNEVNLGISESRNVAIENSVGNYICFLDHDDIIHPQALSIFVKEFIANPTLNFLFSNEAKIDAKSKKVDQFLSKPEFDFFTLLRLNYICHFVAVEKKLLLEQKEKYGKIFRNNFDGVEDFDLYLRISRSKLTNFKLVPLYLYYWRTIPSSTASSMTAKSNLTEKAKNMLMEFLPELSSEVEIILNEPLTFKNSYWSLHLQHKGAQNKKLLIVIPFKDKPELTLQCLEAIEKQETSLSVTVVLVNNNSIDEKTITKLDEFLKQKNKFTYCIEHYEKAFNYAGIHNTAIAKYENSADFILFLNNDIEFISTNIFETLSAHFSLYENSGFVGIKLYYPDNSSMPDIQHGGVYVLPSIDGSGHFSIGHATTNDFFVSEEHVVFGVTFACAMTTMDVWKKLQGLESVSIPNGFGDVDACSKAIKLGLKNYYYGTLEAIHYESKTRGKSSEDYEFFKLYERQGSVIYYARIRQLAYDLGLRFCGMGMILKNPESCHVMEIKPVRYKIADKLNYLIKRNFYPLHQLFKRLFR